MSGPESGKLTAAEGGPTERRDCSMPRPCIDLIELAHRIRDNWDCGGDGWWNALEEMCAVIGRPVERAKAS